MLRLIFVDEVASMTSFTRRGNSAVNKAASVAMSYKPVRGLLDRLYRANCQGFSVLLNASALIQ